VYCRNTQAGMGENYFLESLLAARRTNFVGDIDGATPKRRWKVEHGRPNLMTRRDIDGAEPMRLHVGKMRGSQIDINTTVNEIDAKPRMKMFRTKRVVNPLDPVYDLPKAEFAPIQEPRFLRNSFDVSDIERAQPRKFVLKPEHNPLDVSDIHGATAETSFILERRRRVRGPDPSVDPLNIGDIIGSKTKSRRQTNPLDPVYRINDATIENDADFKPRKQKGEIYSNKERMALRTDDILGALPDSKIRKSREKFKKPPPPKDQVLGAQANTLRRGITDSKRRTNPLQPTYRGLDGETSRYRNGPCAPIWKRLQRIQSQVQIAESDRTYENDSERPLASCQSESVLGKMFGSHQQKLAFPEECTMLQPEYDDASLEQLTRPKGITFPNERRSESPSKVPKSKRNPTPRPYFPSNLARDEAERNRDKQIVASLPDSLTGTQAALFRNHRRT